MTAPFRRHVLYLPGFDPIPPRRYRELYRREAADQSRISGHRLRITKAQAQGFAWAVHGRVEGRDTTTVIEVALWSDIVQASMRQGIAGTFAQLARTSWTYIATGALSRLMRLRRGPVIAALYPIAVLLAQLALALLAGALAAWAVGGWLGLPLGLAVAWGVLVLGRRLDHRLFAYYLMHDYAFTARHRGAYPPALEDRLDQFRARLRAILDDGPDEVLVVGHSSGAYLAVSLLADLLRERTDPGPALSLLTLGHVVPMAAFLPDAGRLRDDLGGLSRRRPPSKAGSMMRRWRAQSAPFAMKTPLPNNGARPSRMRFDFGKSPGRSFRISRISAGSLQKKLWISGVRNSAIQAPYSRSGSAPSRSCRNPRISPRSVPRPCAPWGRGVTARPRAG